MGFHFIRLSLVLTWYKGALESCGGMIEAPAEVPDSSIMYFATNVYGWTLLAKREGYEWNVARAMAEAKRAGVKGWEHAFRTVHEVQPVVEEAKQQGLEMHSAYLFGVFHEPDLAQDATVNTLEIADALRHAGVRNLIINPEPLPGGALKSDQQLSTQAKAINSLGKALCGIGSRLLLHSHDPEMKAGAREFHHMLVNSDSQWVRMCLDVHWVCRGAQNSQAALHDIISLYASRIDLLHLRQSVDGVWSESLGKGDIDFVALAQHLKVPKVKALMTLELCMEDGISGDLSGEQANANAITYLQPLLDGLAIDPSVEPKVPLRIYIYGGGAIAQQHAYAAKSTGKHELLVADPSASARESFAEAFPHTKLFNHAQELPFSRT